MDHSDRRHEPERDLVAVGPVVERTVGRLERSFGPSCLLSLVIVLVVAVVLKRFLHLSWVSLGVVMLAVWVGIMVFLVRLRPVRPIDQD